MRKSFLTLVLILVISSGAILSANASENKIYNLTDPATDLIYTVRINGSDISVSLNGEVIRTTYISNISACSLYGKILTLYSVDSLNGILNVFTWDFYNDSIDSMSIYANAFLNQYCFASDSHGTVYFVSGSDTTKLCAYNNGSINIIPLGSPIKQVLCIDGENVIAITIDSVCSSDGLNSDKILDYSIPTPVYYCGSNKVADINGKDYTLNDKSLTETEPSATIATNTSPVYMSDIYVAESGITVSKLKKAFADFEITKVAKADGSVIQSGKVGTGATLTLSTGDIITVIIYGELTGEGNVNSRDLKAVLNHLSEKEPLEGFFLTAADADNDGKVTTKDALLIAGMF